MLWANLWRDVLGFVKTRVWYTLRWWGNVPEWYKAALQEVKPPVAHALRPERDVTNGGFMATAHSCIHTCFTLNSFICAPHFAYLLFAWACPEPNVCSLSEFLPDSLQREECMWLPRWATINISPVLRLHLCRVLNGGIFMKHKYLQRKAVSQWLRRGRGR